MRVYFLGDIHGNVHALEACIKQLGELEVDKAYCLGDLVGWLPFGDRALARMRSLDLPTVAGNHDLMVAGLFADHPNQVDRMQATAYNAGLISSVPGGIDYLLNLPLVLEEDDFTVVHHSPFHLPEPETAPTIENFNYLDETELTECLAAWQTYPKRIIFSGHDHIPIAYELPDKTDPAGLSDVHVFRPDPLEPLTIKLNPHSRYWIKAGSVGGPYRDGVPVANPVLYDSSAETITLFRLEYPKDELSRELGAHWFSRNLPTIRKYLELLNKDD
jgi:predicted phosphodiesterase